MNDTVYLLQSERCAKEAYRAWHNSCMALHANDDQAFDFWKQQEGRWDDLSRRWHFMAIGA